MEEWSENVRQSALHGEAGITKVGKNNGMIQETMQFNPQGQQFSLMDKNFGKIENEYKHKQSVAS